MKQLIKSSKDNRMRGQWWIAGRRVERFPGFATGLTFGKLSRVCQCFGLCYLPFPPIRLLAYDILGLTWINKIENGMKALFLAFSANNEINKIFDSYNAPSEP